jgi:hypothetical protein
MLASYVVVLFPELWSLSTDPASALFAGSANVRMGFASQDVPFNVPHCVARHKIDAGKLSVRDQVMQIRIQESFSPNIGLLDISSVCDCGFSFRGSTAVLGRRTTQSGRSHMIL